MFFSHAFIPQQKKMVLVKAGAESCWASYPWFRADRPFYCLFCTLAHDLIPSPQPPPFPQSSSVFGIKTSVSQPSLFITPISYACPCGLMRHPHEEVLRWCSSGPTERWKLNPESGSPPQCLPLVFTFSVCFIVVSESFMCQHCFPHPLKVLPRERHGKSSFCKALREWKLWRNLWSTSKLYSLFAQRARLSTQERVVFLPPEGGRSPSEEAILWPSVKQMQVMISSFSEWLWQLLKGQAPPPRVQAVGPGCGRVIQQVAAVSLTPPSRKSWEAHPLRQISEEKDHTLRCSYYLPQDKFSVFLVKRKNFTSWFT